MKRKKIEKVAAKLGIVEEIMKDKEDDLAN
jgi:hypothetical protein